MLARNLLYTGVTRGKQLVVVIGQPRAVAIAVRNVRSVQRLTNLASGCGKECPESSAAGWTRHVGSYTVLSPNHGDAAVWLMYLPHHSCGGDAGRRASP